jgi:hypothetical protein
MSTTALLPAPTPTLALVTGTRPFFLAAGVAFFAAGALGAALAGEAIIVKTSEVKKKQPKQFGCR